MSAEPLITTPVPPAPPSIARVLPWDLYRRQVAAILALEVRKSFLGKRALGVYFLALMPVTILALRAIFARAFGNPSDVSDATRLFAMVFQTFFLRLVIFFGCVEIFGNLIRREMLERTLHYYFLSPVRREVLATAKYLTGLLVSFTLFGGATAASFLLALLAYAPNPGLDLFFQGPGFGHLLAYVGVTFLACLGYGAVFLTFGFFFKSPAIPAVIVFGWEAINFLLPPFLKKISMIHYLESLCPVPVPLGPFAIPADATSPWLAIPGIFLLTAVLLAISGWKIRKLEISYEED
jgi:ABC-type transport system involved in multi-copper enzyme maturation permease subunit